jgi:hypothetical protein
MSLRLLITGDRYWTDDRIIKAVLDPLYAEHPNMVVIQGGADGADTIAGDVAEWLGIKVLEFRADWNKFGRGAGPIRNQQMLDEGQPTAVMAFHPNLRASRGTLDMVKKARRANLPVTWLDDKANAVSGEALDEYLKTC